ncbi:MATE family efflux transporter [uncultured Methanobrevibacter sp.]|uniref:MATE family efflux transporter n=1 Tax=uncultured Methanobrevibacter sp. TaxID=253161 RepID=UPI0025E9419A|nr:MATE family efflux transporter [uncultured Methanobrevibacter sp.]
MITGDPKKAIVKLSYPLMLTMILLMMYNLVDSIWVAGLGTEALAAIGFVTPLFMAVIGMGNGVAADANSLIARMIGAEDYDQANNAALHSILLSVIISAILTAIMLIFMVPILEAIGARDTMQYSLDYSYVIFGFMFVIVFEELASAIFRAEGDIRRATIVIAASVVVNIVLDPILIYHFNIGISGAAWATIISTVFSCSILAYLIWGKKICILICPQKNLISKLI